MSRLFIRNGRVVDPSQGLDEGMDLLIEDGVVAELAERLEPPKRAKVLDAAELVVAPGFIDLHAHLREPGAEHKETIATGLQAAVAGGFTGVCCTADTRPVNDDPSVTRFIRERGEQVGLARLYPYGALSKGLGGEELAEIGELVREGAVAISDDARPVPNALLMRRALEYSRSFGVRIASHPQDPVLADGGSMHEGEISTRIGLRGIPAAAEAVTVARDIALARLTGGRLHLSLLSTRDSLEQVRQAKAAGTDLTCGVAAHHVALSDRDVAEANYDPNWKVAPPFRSPVDVEAVHQALYDGIVDAIVSDHAPHHADDKELDFQDAPFGAVGLETAVAVALDCLVQRRVIGVLQLVRLFSTGPAAALDLPGGSLRPGSPGDVTLIDLRARRAVDPTSFRSKARNTPLAGRTLKGWPAATVVAGKVVWQAR